VAGSKGGVGRGGELSHGCGSGGDAIGAVGPRIDAGVRIDVSVGIHLRVCVCVRVGVDIELAVEMGVSTALGRDAAAGEDGEETRGRVCERERHH
jgi:hypothetical protein